MWTKKIQNDFLQTLINLRVENLVAIFVLIKLIINLGSIHIQVLYMNKSNSNANSVTSPVACSFTTDRYQKVRTHIDREHKGINYPCNKCEFISKTKAALNTHIEGIHENIRYPCEYCDYQATTKSNLAVHIQSNEGKKYPCQVCGYQATT